MEILASRKRSSPWLGNTFSEQQTASLPEPSFPGQCPVPPAEGGGTSAGSSRPLGMIPECSQDPPQSEYTCLFCTTRCLLCFFPLREK